MPKQNDGFTGVPPRLTVVPRQDQQRGQALVRTPAPGGRERCCRSRLPARRRYSSRGGAASLCPATPPVVRPVLDESGSNCCLGRARLGQSGSGGRVAPGGGG